MKALKHTVIFNIGFWGMGWVMGYPPHELFSAIAKLVIGV